MPLRSLGSLLTRRLFISFSRAQAKAAPVPARSLRSQSHSHRDFVAGAYGGGVAAAALAGLAGILYFTKGEDESSIRHQFRELFNHIYPGGDRGGSKEAQLAREAAMKQGAIMTEAETKEHMHNEDDFSLEEYLADMTRIAAAQRKAHYERSYKKAVKAVSNNYEAINDDEAAMKARFEEWIREYGKRYKSKEEKARRYELFKDFANVVDKATTQGGAVFVTIHTADWTEEECRCLYDSDVDDWDDYLDHIRSLIDKENAKAKKDSRG